MQKFGNSHGHAFQIRKTYCTVKDNCFEITVPSSLHHRPVTAAVTALSNTVTVPNRSIASIVFKLPFNFMTVLVLYYVEFYS